MNDWMMERSVDELELSVRTYNCLKRTEINTIADLAQKTERELLTIHQLGRKGVLEIRRLIRDLGLDLVASDKELVELEHEVANAALEVSRAEQKLIAAVNTLRHRREQIQISEP